MMSRLHLSLKLFYYIWLTDFSWLRCIKRKVCNHFLTPEELMILHMNQFLHHADFTHERTFVVQECNARRSNTANRWCIIINGMTAPNLLCLCCNYNNWGNFPRPGLLIMGVLDYIFNQHLRDNLTYQPRSLTLILDNPINQNKNNVMLGILSMLVHCGFLDEVFLFFQQPGHMHNDLDQCFSSPSNYFKANNVMSLPEVPEVFTSSWANRAFLRSFRVQVSDLKHCYMLANYFETYLEFLQKNLDIMLLGCFVSWLTSAAWWKWVRGGMNQKDIIEMVMLHKCTKLPRWQIHYNLIMNFLLSKVRDKLMLMLKLTFFVLKSDPRSFCMGALS
eukprot:m51a1_g10387 hypothetical protein (333) ;mRNA; f:2969-12632